MLIKFSEILSTYNTALLVSNAVEIWKGEKNKIQSSEGKLPKSEKLWITDGKYCYGLFTVNKEFKVEPIILFNEPEPIKYKFGSFFVIKDMQFKEHDEYMRVPDENKKWNYGMKLHFRGKSVHTDLMFERENDVIGWTVLVQKQDTIKDSVTTISQAREFFSANKANAFKINFENGELTNSVRAVKKQAESLSMLFSEEEHDKSFNEQFIEDVIISEKTGLRYETSIIQKMMEGVIEKGQPGATKELPGVYIVIDKGEAEYLYQDELYHEYWLSNGILKEGRYILRALEQKQYNEFIISGKYHKMHIDKKAESRYYWVFSYSEEEVPYVLTINSIEKEKVTPYGYSMIPKHIRTKVPKEYKYWEVSSPSKALAMRKKLIEDKVLSLKQE